MFSGGLALAFVPVLADNTIVMANMVIDRWPDNATGRFYVDEQCIDCDLCRDNAPEVFARNGVDGHSFVRQQPDTPDAIERCMAAIDICPVGAIHSDG